DRAVEILRKNTLAVALQPVLRVEPRAQFCDRVADGLLIGGERKIHRRQGRGNARRVKDKCRSQPSRVTPFCARPAISLSLYPASRRTSVECSPRRGAGGCASGCDSDQLVG